MNRLQVWKTNAGRFPAFPALAVSKKVWSNSLCRRQLLDCWRLLFGQQWFKNYPTQRQMFRPRSALNLNSLAVRQWRYFWIRTQWGWHAHPSQTTCTCRCPLCCAPGGGYYLSGPARVRNAPLQTDSNSVSQMFARLSWQFNGKKRLTAVI